MSTELTPLQAAATRFPTAPEITQTSQKTVACDGGGGALGHPKTWYTMNDEGYVRCGYCDRVFVYVPGA